MIDEAVQLNELALMGSMLLSLLKFDGVCSSGNDEDGQGASLSEEQTRHQVLTDLKGCDSSLQTVIKQAQLLLTNLDQF